MIARNVRNMVHSPDLVRRYQDTYAITLTGVSVLPPIQTMKLIVFVGLTGIPGTEIMGVVRKKST